MTCDVPFALPRAGDLGLPARWARRVLARARARRCAIHRPRRRMAQRYRRRARPQRGRHDRPRDRLPAGAGLSRRLLRHPGRRPESRRHGGRCAQAVDAADGPPDRRCPVRPLPGGWTGKLWAMEQGVAHASSAPERRTTCCSPMPISPTRRTTVRSLVARAEAGGLVLTSLMAQSVAAKVSPSSALIPAFVFFFQMLYPFALGERCREDRWPARRAAACSSVPRRWKPPAASTRFATRSSTIARSARR